MPVLEANSHSLLLGEVTWDRVVGWCQMILTRNSPFYKNCHEVLTSNCWILPSLENILYQRYVFGCKWIPYLLRIQSVAQHCTKEYRKKTVPVTACTGIKKLYSKTAINSKEAIWTTVLQRVAEERVLTRTELASRAGKEPLGSSQSTSPPSLPSFLLRDRVVYGTLLPAGEEAHAGTRGAPLRRTEEEPCFWFVFISTDFLQSSSEKVS